MLSQKESAIPGDMVLDSLPEIIKQTPTELDNSSLESGFTPLEPVSSYLYFSSINIVNAFCQAVLFLCANNKSFAFKELVIHI